MCGGQSYALLESDIIMQYSSESSLIPSVFSAGTVLFNDKGEVLLVQQGKNHPAHGLWHIPCGTVEANENFEMAAVRETFEETGVKVQLGNFLGAYPAFLPDGAIILRLAWLAEFTEQNSSISTLTSFSRGEIAQLEWFTPLEIQKLYVEKKLRMHFTLQAIQAGYRKHSGNLF
jgi:8-oxo-dGTP diphosphatase